MSRTLFAVVCLLASAAAAQGRAEEMFNSFGPGMTTQPPPGEGQGGACLSVSDFTTWRVAWSVRFTPTATARFTRAQLGLVSWVPQDGPGRVVVLLQDDALGLPGPTLERIEVGGLTSAPKVASATSRALPELRAGYSYWLSVLAAPNSVTCWLLTPLCGESGPPCPAGLAALDYNPAGLPADVLPWETADAVAVRPAIRIEGAGVTPVRLDILPGGEANSVNPRSNGVIPVAVMSSEGFDPATIDPRTVRFGRTGSEAAPVRSSLENLDGDGYVDLVLQFRTPETAIACGDTTAVLTGATIAGEGIRGADSIRTVGCR